MCSTSRSKVVLLLQVMHLLPGSKEEAQKELQAIESELAIFKVRTAAAAAAA